MRHTSTELLATATTVAQIIGPDRVEHVQVSVEGDRVLMQLEHPQAVTEFADYYEGRRQVTPMGARDVHAASAVVNGVEVNVQASEYARLGGAA